MIGKLDPEENVMNGITLSEYAEDYDEKFFAWENNGVMDQIQDFIETLDWSGEDDIVVEIGGTQVSGIDVGENYNEKWQSPIGTRKYNKDAFIVIKNRSRSPFAPSQPNPDLKGHHEIVTEG